MKLREHLQLITRSESLEELWSLHCQKMKTFGFDRLLYGLTRFRHGRTLGDPEDFVILSNHDPGYVERFISEGHYHHAPMLQWALDHDGACSWGVTAKKSLEGSMAAQEQEVLRYNQSMGVTVGYTISFRTLSARSKGAIALTSREGMSQSEADAIWAQHGFEIELMNEIAHLKILTLPQSVPHRCLTSRQREALEWVGDGKTTQDVALLMGLTIGTVEKHLRLAREVLSVDTTAQAVLKASVANQIFMFDC